MLKLFPAIQPFATYRLPVQAPHEIYVEECGNPHGLPILFLHGGPGSGCSEDSRCWFDPNRYRIILFDQRGAGRSTPHAELHHNNTQSLLTDIETIRQSLKIERWALFGGSWGATLALVYAQTYPQQVTGIVLTGTFLATLENKEWLYGGHGANRIYPDYWQDFLAILPAEHRQHLLYEYYELLIIDNELVRMKAAETWARWEARCSMLTADETYIAQRTTPHKALAFARIECHYFINNFFLEPNQILRDMATIQHIPALLIHGRYDMVCPIKNSWDLHQAWPKSEFYIVPDAGHSLSEPGIRNACILATEKLAGMIIT